MTTPSDPTPEVRRQARRLDLLRPSLLDVLFVIAGAYLGASAALFVWHGLERALDVHEVVE